MEHAEGDGLSIRDVIRRDIEVQRLWRRTQWKGHRDGRGSERPLPMGNKRAKEDDDCFLVTNDT